MNRKTILILFGVLTLCFFLGRNYLYMKKQESEYKNYRKPLDQKNDDSPLRIDKGLDISNNRTTTIVKPVFKFVSNSNDLENTVEILQTNNEISYHTFDFNKNTISFKSLTKNDQWQTQSFKIKKSIVNESVLGLKGMEFEIDNPRCHLIWVSSIGNIGYEFTNGQTLVFYGVKELY